MVVLLGGFLYGVLKYNNYNIDVLQTISTTLAHRSSSTGFRVILARSAVRKLVQGSRSVRSRCQHDSVDVQLKFSHVYVPSNLPMWPIANYTDQSGNFPEACLTYKSCQPISLLEVHNITN